MCCNRRNSCYYRTPCCSNIYGNNTFGGNNCGCNRGGNNGCGTNSGIVFSTPAVPVNSGCTGCSGDNNALALGMAYVPWQDYGNTYPIGQGFQQGTLFPDLNYEFMGRRCN